PPGWPCRQPPVCVGVRNITPRSAFVDGLPSRAPGTGRGVRLGGLATLDDRTAFGSLSFDRAGCRGGERHLSGRASGQCRRVRAGAGGWPSRGRSRLGAPLGTGGVDRRIRTPSGLLRGEGG